MGWVGMGQEQVQYSPWLGYVTQLFSDIKMVDPVEYIWALFEETPRPSHLPPCLFPNEYPFELGFKYYPQPELENVTDMTDISV